MLINEREARSVDGLRVVMYGIGSVGSTLTRMLVERGAEIVGALARSPEKEGRDVGDLIGLAAPLGVTVTLDPDELLATKPDIVVMTVASYMDDMYEHVERCIQAGTNVISLSEELLYPWHTSGDRAAALDAAAKAAGVTVACTGHQDGYWVSLVSVLMGTAFRIDTVEGVATWNVDDFGAELARDQLVGSTVADFEEWAATAERPPTFGRGRGFDRCHDNDDDDVRDRRCRRLVRGAADNGSPRPSDRYDRCRSSHDRRRGRALAGDDRQGVRR